MTTDKFLNNISENKYIRAKNALLKLNKEIRKSIPDINETIKLDRVSISEVKEGYLHGQAIERVIIILRSSGCSWALDENGGCFMCGHICGTSRGEGISAENFCKQFDNEISKYDFSKYPMLCLYNSGSFLNDKEIPKEARKHIYERINSIHGIKRLIIESRPEFVTESVLSEIEDKLENVEVEIGVGLESSNENIRELCLNKGSELEEFIELTSRMKFSRIKLLAYVLLKPPFLTEMEAIDDTLKTISFAFNIGVDIVSLEPLSIQDFTIASFLYETGYFRPPWIWSVLEIIKKTYNLGPIRLGGFEFFPIPKLFTHNCVNCNEKMLKAIQKFNSEYNIHVFDGLNCSCKQEWEFDLKEVDEDLQSRILRILSMINVNEILKMMRMNFDIRGPKLDNIHKLLFKSCSTPNL